MTIRGMTCIAAFAALLVTASAQIAAAQPCTSDVDCNDGLFCTVESCSGGFCGAVSACPPAIQGCLRRNAFCDEQNDRCVDQPSNALCAVNEFCTPTGECVTQSARAPVASAWALVSIALGLGATGFAAVRRRSR